MSLRERTRPGLGIIELQRLPATAAMFALLVILGTPAVATAQSTQISEVRSVLSDITDRQKSDLQARYPGSRGGAEITIDDQGQITWKSGVTCFQRIWQMRLSDLDPMHSEVNESDRIPGEVIVKIPCRSGQCARFEDGTGVWPIFGACETALSAVVSYTEVFNSPPIAKRSAEELLSALRGR